MPGPDSASLFALQISFPLKGRRNLAFQIKIHQRTCVFNLCCALDSTRNPLQTPDLVLYASGTEPEHFVRWQGKQARELELSPEDCTPRRRAAGWCSTDDKCGNDMVLLILWAMFGAISSAADWGRPSYPNTTQCLRLQENTFQGSREAHPVPV